MKAIMLVCALLISQSAIAEELSAGQLYAFCTSREAVARASCRFFILGAVLGIGLGDGAVMGPDKRLREKPRTHFCIPDDTGQDQMVSVFQDAVRLLVTAYPEDLKLPAMGMVDASMSRRYPCK
jgi:hypothetical protein